MAVTKQEHNDNFPYSTVFKCTNCTASVVITWPFDLNRVLVNPYGTKAVLFCPGCDSPVQATETRQT